jgi:hypothetical protein
MPSLRTKSRLAAVPLAGLLVVVALIAAPALAGEPAPPPPPSELDQARHDVRAIRAALGSAFRELRDAHLDRDRLREHCIREQVLIIRKLLKSAEEALAGLEHALADGDESAARHYREAIATAKEDAEEALELAKRCSAAPD